MKTTNRPKSKGIIRLYIFTAVVALIYLGALFLFAYLARSAGDPDIAGFRTIINYYLINIKDLFLLNYSNNSNIAYFALSIFLYALIICWIIFLIGAIVIYRKKKRRIIWWALLLALINLGVYALYAAGSKKYWQIINRYEPFGDNTRLMFVSMLVIIFGSLHIAVSLISYFWAVFESFINPYIEKEDEPVEIESQEPQMEEEPEDEDQDEKIRAIIRDEIAKNQPFKVIITNELNFVKEEVAPVPAPVIIKEIIREVEPVKEEKPEPKPEPIPEPVKEEEPEPSELDIPLAEEKEEEPLPVVEPSEEEEAWSRNKRQPFLNRIITADTDIKVNYNEIKNEILSYGVKSRLSRGGETFRLKDKRYVKIYLVGKTLKVYFALSPEDYKDSTIPVEDVGHRPNYADMPLLFKVRSGLSVRRCKELVKAALEKDGLTQGEVQDVNWVDELRKINAEKAKKK